MIHVDRWFLRSAVLFALAGMVLGIGMGISQDFALADAHAHINLVGWVTLALYGLFYRVCPDAAQGAMPRIHFATAVTGAVLLGAGIVGIKLEMAAGEPAAILGSLFVLAGMLIFAMLVYRRF